MQSLKESENRHDSAVNFMDMSPITKKNEIKSKPYEPLQSSMNKRTKFDEDLIEDNYGN